MNRDARTHTGSFVSDVWQVTGTQLRQSTCLHRPRKVCHEAFVGLGNKKRQVRERGKGGSGGRERSLNPGSEAAFGVSGMMSGEASAGYL